MKIGIINIGDELLGGKILNSNQFDLARMLTPLGHDILFNLVVGDDEGVIARSLAWASGSDAPVKPDMLILTGGLGPTHDDMTRQAVAGFLGRPVVESPEALSWLGLFLGRPDSEMPPGQRVQTCIPQGTFPLRNPAGTACGFRFAAAGIPAFAFPGVPSELDAMARLHLVPDLQGDSVLLERVLYTWGWSESDQRQAFKGIDLPSGYRFSSLPGERGVRLTLSILCAPVRQSDAALELDSVWNRMVRCIPAVSIVDLQGAALPQAVLKLLLARKATVSVAESCTGGGLGFLLTETSGSSAVFHKGYLTYSNAAKTELLGVDAELLKRFGAVSQETALAMAQGCLERSGADYAVSITGIAGPDGGTAEKPVGTVWIAVATKGFATARLFKMRGDRSVIRWRSAHSALNLLRLLISGQLEP